MREQWNESRDGVFALLGAFGSGKSLLASNFIDELRKGETRDQSRDCHHIPIFEFSFERGRNIEFYFEGLVGWIRGAEWSRQNVGWQPTIYEIDRVLKVEVTEPILIALDAIEQATEGEGDADFPTLSPLLEELLARAASGEYEGKVSWLVTSHVRPNEARLSSLDTLFEPVDLLNESYFVSGESDF